MNKFSKKNLSLAKDLATQIFNFIKKENNNKRIKKFIHIGIPILIIKVLLFLKFVRFSNLVLSYALNYALREDEAYKRRMIAMHKALAATGESFYCFHLKGLRELFQRILS